MPRRPNIERPVPLTLKLPEMIRGRLDLHLFSHLEQRVPKGKYQEFFVARIIEFFEHKTLSLEAFGFPPGFEVRGNKEVIEELERRLKNGG